MSTICCLTVPSNSSSLPHPSSSSSHSFKDNSNIIFNRHLSPMSATQPFVFLTDNIDVNQIDLLHENDKLLLPHSTRHLKRRTSIFEKSRDWARRFLTLHRSRCNTISNEKLRRSCYDFHRKSSIPKVISHPSPIEQSCQKSFDEDGYLSPMEIKAKLDIIAREKVDPSNSSLSKFSSHSQHMLVCSHSNNDLSQAIYRCHHGPMTHSTKCTCPNASEVPLSRASYLSDFHRSLSVVDYIDDDVPEESISPSRDLSPRPKDDDHDDDDPIIDLKYLFDEKVLSLPSSSVLSINNVRRPPRRTTNTSSISTDSGYCDLPMTSSMSSSSSSKLIPVHLISCTLIPVNVTRPDQMDIHYLTCTCPSASTTTTSSLSSSSMYNIPHRTQRKSSSQLHRIPSRSPMEIIDQPCSCHPKYYSSMAVVPPGPSPLSMTTTKSDSHDRKKQSRKKRTTHRRLPIVHDDLSAVSRWYKPYLDRDAVCHSLQQADYGAFILRDSTTHRDCYALSVKVPKFTHDSNIAHYLIERILENQSYSYRIKGTMKQFPTLISLLTHHSVMPEILPITLNLHEIIAI